MATISTDVETALRLIMFYVNRGEIEGLRPLAVTALEQGEQALVAFSGPTPAAQDGREGGGEPCDGGQHCCCCSPGELCCDCGEIMNTAADGAPFTYGVPGCDCAARFYGDDPTIHQGCCALSDSAKANV